MAEIPRKSGARAAKLASLPLGMAARSALGVGKRLTGTSKADVDAQLSAKAAEQLFSVLGELKGGAMKLGQALSVMEAAIPPEFAEPYREALTKLQSAAPPMPTRDVHKMLSREFGRDWRTRFESFDDTPAASASVGQVHRAVWHDGRDVAVKVQYPGADEALRSDLKTLARFSSLFNTVMPGADVGSIIDEFNSRTEEELDYRIEADNQRAFAKAYAHDELFAVPKVVASSPKAFVTEWMTGTPLADVIRSGSQDERDLAGTRIAQFHFQSPARVGKLHADPHPGNFMMLDDGRLGVIDFGATAQFPDGLPPVLGAMVRYAVDERFDELTALLADNGFVNRGATVDPQEVADYLRPFTDPLKSEYFHFTREWLSSVAGTVSDVSSPQFRVGRHLTMPPEYLMIFRVLMGSVGICSQLGAYAPYMGILTTWMPGFLEPGE